MDSRGSEWSSNCNSSNSCSNNKKGNNSSSRRGSKERGGGLGQGGRLSPSDYYYSGGAGGETKDSYESGLYTTNNNDYSKYNCSSSNGSGGYLPPSGLDYSHYGDSSRGPYCSSSTPPPCDAGCSDNYSNDCGYSVNCGYSQCPGEQSSCPGSQCSCGHVDYGECDPYGSCNQQEYTPSQVQVTAKVLFGSVSAISNLKQKKPSKK